MEDNDADIVREPLLVPDSETVLLCEGPDLVPVRDVERVCDVVGMQVRL